MKTRVSSKGQVVIPQEVRERLGLQEGSELDIEVGDACVVLRKARNSSAWRAWQGRYSGVDLTKALKEDRRAEAQRELQKGF